MLRRCFEMGLLSVLQELLAPERATENETILEGHSSDESYHTPHLPVGVVYPETAQEVSDVVKLVSEKKVTVVRFGLGSSLEGNVIHYSQGIMIDMSLMNKVLDIMADDFLVKVQPGVTRTQLEKELKKYGLFFPVDPGADATLGGMAATNASGTTSVKY